MEELTNVTTEVAEKAVETVEVVVKEGKKSLKPALEKVGCFIGGTIVGGAIVKGVQIVKAGRKALAEQKAAETEAESDEIVTETSEKMED